MTKSDGYSNTTAEKAVITLNEMYLEAEKELDEKVFACAVQRATMKKALEMTEAELSELGGAGDDATKTKKEAEDAAANADQEIQNQTGEIETLTKNYEAIKEEDDKELEDEV